MYHLEFQPPSLSMIAYVYSSVGEQSYCWWIELFDIYWRWMMVCKKLIWTSRLLSWDREYISITRSVVLYVQLQHDPFQQKYWILIPNLNLQVYFGWLVKLPKLSGGDSVVLPGIYEQKSGDFGDAAKYVWPRKTKRL